MTIGVGTSAQPGDAERDGVGSSIAGEIGARAAEDFPRDGLHGSLGERATSLQERATTFDHIFMRGGQPSAVLLAEDRAVLGSVYQPDRDRLDQLFKVLGHHRYVSVELPGESGLQTVHIVRPENHPDLISVHVTSEKTMPSGARYSSLDARTFLQVGSGEPLNGQVADVAYLDRVLNQVGQFLHARAQRPLLVNVSPQGYHERDKRLVLGLTDTGGQDKFIEDVSLVSAQLGFQVINVNRGGPNHPKLGDVREGMHYGADGVDLLFLDDEKPVFIRKEDMFDEVLVDETTSLDLETLEGKVVRKGPCEDLARSLLMQLRREQSPVALIGHYADGGETIRHVVGMMEADGIPVPRVVHIPHSTGLLKKARLEAEGKPVDPSLRMPHREHAERLVYESTDVLLSTSRDMTASLEHQYGATVHGMVLIGVQTDRFHPREPGVERNDPRYDPVWQELSMLSGRSIAELQAAQMVLEYSRTAPAKDKATTIRAFAESLRGADHDRILVINIADPEELKVDGIPDSGQVLEREHAIELRSLVAELGLEGKVIMKHSFKNDFCAQLCQLADVYISSAILEPWGMAVQEAAASGLPIVACRNVAIASELLAGKNTSIEIDGEECIVEKGSGALLFGPGDYQSAAYALNRLLNAGGEAERAEVAQGAYSAVIPSCTWEGILTRLWSEHLGVEFRDGQVVVTGRAHIS